jgi:quinol monooxygenase YgiN
LLPQSLLTAFASRQANSPKTNFEQFRDSLSKDCELLITASERFELATVASFFRPATQCHADPYIVFATLRYDSVTSAEKAAEGFSGVCSFSEKEEPGTLAYNVLRDLQDPRLVRTLEIYVDQAYLWCPHAKSDAVQANKNKQGDTRLKVDFVFLALVDGHK